MTYPEDHSDFCDRVGALAEQHPDENDPYWDEFWRLKSTEELESHE
jgi:hypothetical protein